MVREESAAEIVARIVEPILSQGIEVQSVAGIWIQDWREEPDMPRLNQESRLMTIKTVWATLGTVKRWKKNFLDPERRLAVVSLLSAIIVYSRT